ncbi:cell wall hydrolase [Govanella unica]|uniref:Cell wall hydrolase n=1 Tax=Govanella unica TaxID=2975056 RepID=A0A9X3Z7X7_9PROT|nr:cell wall hydrolase [Govania unica]MDA5194493.1 cell wall hydrolase [Govania unica]
MILLTSLPLMSVAHGASPSASAPVIPASSPAAQSPAVPSSLDRLGSMIGGLHRVGTYVSVLSKDASDVSQQEIAVASQYRCLAQAVYFEARGETKAGQQAVAHVVLNRLRDGRYPSTICGVVYQNKNQPNRCQFSFACDGRSDKPNDKWAWRQSLKVALEALTGASKDATRASTHFHARSVEPEWAMTLKQTVKVGQHVFYQEPTPNVRFVASR